jgi:5-hydroxyisourate hydrolase-like protein (transthyretin family)
MISTHVLDTERGRPAEGVRVELYRGDEFLAAKETDADGRISDLAGDLEAGDYRLVFLPASSPFFKRIELEVALDGGKVHIPLLLAPYGCTTYRGS